VKADISDGTLAGLDVFLEQYVHDPDFNTVTMSAMKSSTRSVAHQLGLDPADRVADLDVEATMDRFQQAKGPAFRSAATYRTRMRTATQLYLAWLTGDPDWKAVARTRSAGRPAPVPATAPSATPPSARSIRVIEFPVDHALTIRLELPDVLTRPTADRLTALINSFVVDDPKV
jgi:hypothetical protein